MSTIPDSGRKIRALAPAAMGIRGLMASPGA
jgi:hypothetical protein